MTIDPISLPPFPLGGLAMQEHMAAIQAWGMACAKVGVVAALDEIQNRPDTERLTDTHFRLRDQLSGKTNEGSGG